jgi:hypothetical protein
MVSRSENDLQMVGTLHIYDERSTSYSETKHRLFRESLASS